jgi:transposase
LKGTTPTAAQLIRRDGKFFLHIQVPGAAAEAISPVDCIGVDMGIAKIATTSDDPEGHTAPIGKDARDRRGARDIEFFSRTDSDLTAESRLYHGGCHDAAMKAEEIVASG